MKNKHKKTSVGKFFQIDWIYIKTLIAASISIFIGTIGIITYFADGRKDDEILWICVGVIIVAVLVIIFRKQLNNWML